MNQGAADRISMTVIEVKKELQPYQNDFNAKDYIEALSGRLVSQARSQQSKGIRVTAIQNISNATEFDPQPLLKVFEIHLEELIKLRKAANRKIGDLEDIAKAAETSYRSQISDMSRTFEKTCDSFRQLEKRIGEVGGTAILIGDQIENIDKQRLRALEAKDLVLHFSEFNRGNTARLDLLKNNSSWEDRAKAGRIVKRLVAISKEVDLPQVETARQSIDKYAENYEKDILEEFNQSYKDGNTSSMATCAKILTDFNGGQSCIQVYVNQHEFFTSKIKLLDMEAAMTTSATGHAPPLSSKTMSEYENSAPPLDRALDRIYQEIRLNLMREWSTISIIFPYPVLVMQTFLQRLFAHSIGSYVEGLLKKAQDQSLLSYLRTLFSVYRATFDLEQDLRKFASQVIKDVPARNGFNTTFQRCREDIFVPYLDNDKYQEVEIKSLLIAIQQTLAPFNEAVQARKQKAKNQGMFTKLSNATPLINSMLGDQQSGLTSNDDTLSVEVISRLTRVHGEALQRCKDLSSISDLARNVSDLFSLFLEQVGKKYIDVCLDSILEEILATEPKTEPDLRYFEIVHTTTSLIHAIQSYFEANIVPLISSQPTVHRETVIKKNDFINALEAKINVIIQKEVESIMIWIGVILSRQKRTDYRPRENELGALTAMSTVPCTQCCDYLKKVNAALSKTMDGKNLESILCEIGIQLYSYLLQHIKKFVISVSGGLLLTKDLAKYQETVAIFKIPEVNERFELLRQLANIYVVLPENLKELTEEGVLVRLDPMVLHAFVALRADYKQAKLFKGMPVEEVQTSPANAWEKGFENAVVAVGDMAGEVGEAMKKILLIE